MSASIYQYSTPTLPLKITGLDFADVETFRVAMERGSGQLLKIIPADDPAVDAENNTVNVKLTQEETAAWTTGEITVQVRVVFQNGDVLPTPKATVTLKDVIDKVVV